MKIACIGPIDPLRTGVAYFNERLFSYLAELCDAEAFTDRRIRGLADSRVADIGRFLCEANRFDAVLYHMGNHYRYHSRVYEALLEAPGFVLLHDCILSHFFTKYYLERGNFRAFRRLLDVSASPALGAQASDFYNARGDFYRFPMAGVIASSARGTIVMSEYGKSIIQKEAPGARVLRIHFPHFPAASPAGAAESFRRRHKLDGDQFIVTFIGHMTPAKRLDVAIEAFREFHLRFPNSVFLIAGEPSAHSPAREAIASSPSGIRFLGYLERAELDSLMEVSCVCVNLRYPSHGEMSSTLIDMLGRGKVVAVSDQGRFSEFPDNVCIRIKPGPHEREELIEALSRLAADGGLRRKREDAAREFVAARHAPAAAAAAVIEFMKENSSVEPLLSKEVRDALLESDPFVLRQKQAAAYNLRRVRLYAKEEGIGRLMGEGIRRTLYRVRLS